MARILVFFAASFACVCVTPALTSDTGLVDSETELQTSETKAYKYGARYWVPANPWDYAGWTSPAVGWNAGWDLGRGYGKGYGYASSGWDSPSKGLSYPVTAAVYPVQILTLPTLGLGGYRDSKKAAKKAWKKPWKYGFPPSRGLGYPSAGLGYGSGWNSIGSGWNPVGSGWNPVRSGWNSVGSSWFPRALDVSHAPINQASVILLSPSLKGRKSYGGHNALLVSPVIYAKKPHSYSHERQYTPVYKHGGPSGYKGRGPVGPVRSAPPVGYRPGGPVGPAGPYSPHGPVLRG